MPDHSPATIARLDRVAELGRLSDEIATLSAHLEAATARLLDLIREFDDLGGWKGHYASCAQWLAWRAGIDAGTARERIRVARALGGLPHLAQAFARGELSYAKVRAIAAPATEERLMNVAMAATAHHVERIVRGWRRVDSKVEAREASARHRGRAVYVHQAEDGMVIIRGRLEPEVGALFMQTLAAAREALYRRRRVGEAVQPVHDPQAEAPTFGQQQADALALIAETALHHGLEPGAAAERYQVVVHVDAPVLADTDQPGQSVLDDGQHVPAGTSQRLACDATRVMMRHDADGRVVEVGARTRTIPPAMRRALQHRDHGCRFPGCGTRFTQGHHIRHWARGGPTTLSNLTLLCRRHHRAVHEEGYDVERQADGELRFRRPDGRLLPEAPPPVPVPHDPLGALRARHEAQGLCLHPWTVCGNWHGDRLDLSYALAVLRPLDPGELSGTRAGG
jgi:5-methylcytosine-specific restriction endonuclease McrA